VDEPWVDLESVDGTYFGPVTVPQGEVFVLGDDRDRSVDSRALGPVPLDAVRGRVLTRWWPWG
jgi:signal peptidase I